MSIFTDIADKFKKKENSDNQPRSNFSKIVEFTQGTINPLSPGRLTLNKEKNKQSVTQRTINKGRGAWGMIQGIFQGAAGFGVTAGQELSGIGAGREKRQQLRKTTVTPKTKFERTLLGNEPISNVAEQTYQFRKSISENAKRRPLLDYPVGIALSVMDFTSGGNAKRVTTSAVPEIIAASKRVDDIVPFLKRLVRGNEEDIVKTANTLSNVSDPRMVEEELLRLSADKNSSINLTKEAKTSIKKMRELDTLANNIEVDEVNNVMNLKTVDGLTPRQIKNTNAWLKDNQDVLTREFKNLKDKTGGRITHAEVMKQTLRIIENESQLMGVLSKSDQTNLLATVKAAQLKAIKNLEDIADGVADGDIDEAIEAFSSQKAFAGRFLEILKNTNNADPLSLDRIVSRLRGMGKTSDEIKADMKAFRDEYGAGALKDPVLKEQFYNKYVKPKLSEILNEWRYINMLSSPKTHLFNIASNLGQVALNIPVRLVSGGLDKIGSKLTGRAREQYMREVPEYVKGAVNGIRGAFSEAMDVLRKGGTLSRKMDMKQRETGRSGWGIYVLRALDAGDTFFKKVITEGEIAALTKRLEINHNKIPNQKTPFKLTDRQINQIQKQAAKTAERLVYRAKLDPSNDTNQGWANQMIDVMASSLFYVGERAPFVRLFIPFILTPTQVLKQGIEYTPILGLANLPRNAAKRDLIAKQIIGSTIVASLATKAYDDEMTWDIPTNKDEREAFYADGRKPYSIKIGDTWIPYSRIGPAGFPMALIAAIAHKYKYGTEATTDSQMSKIIKVVGSMIEFFADQSFVQGLGDILQVVQEGSGIKGGLKEAAENLTRQVIPLSALQGWIARLTDEYIWNERTSFPEGYVDGVMGQLPGFIRNIFGVELVPRTDAMGNYIKRATKSTEESYKNYVENRDISQFNKEKTVTQNAIEEAVSRHMFKIKKLDTREDKIQYMKNIQSSEPEVYDELYKEVVNVYGKKGEPAAKLTRTESRIRSMGISDGSRAEYIVKQLNKLETREEKVQYIKNLQEKKIITDKVFSQIKLLLEK